MGFNLTPETYNLLSVFMGFIFIGWMFRLIEKFNKIVLLREGMRDNRVSHVNALGADLVEFEFCTESHFRALGMIQQDSAPVQCSQVSVPFSIKGDLEIELSEMATDHQGCFDIKFQFESLVSCSIQLVLGLKKDVLIRADKKEDTVGQMEQSGSSSEEEEVEEDGDGLFKEEAGIEMKTVSAAAEEDTSLVTKSDDEDTSVSNWDQCLAVSAPVMFEKGQHSFEHSQKMINPQISRLLKKKDEICVSIVFQQVDAFEGNDVSLSMQTSVMDFIGQRRSFFGSSFSYSPAALEAQDNVDDVGQVQLDDILGISFIQRAGNSELDGEAEALVSLIYMVEKVDLGKQHPAPEAVIVTNRDVISASRIFGFSEDGTTEESSSECTVCLTEPKDTILLPCRHLCVCHTCFSHIDKCPVCRSLFETHIVFDEASTTQSLQSRETVVVGEEHNIEIEDNESSDSDRDTLSPLHT